MRTRGQNWPQWMFHLRPWRYMLDYRHRISQDVWEIEMEDEECLDFHDKKTDPRATLELPTVSTMQLDLERN